MNPFDRTILDEIFQSQQDDIYRIVSRENSSLEFKQSFGTKSLASYSRTMCGFANATGGYIVFGVKNQPHEAIGLQNNSFDEHDPARFTEYLNSHYSAEICWEKTQINYHGKKIGLIYTYESKVKPVICTKNESDDIKEAEIYYRYRGRTEKIRYPELKAIIEREKKVERVQWMQFLRKISKVDINSLAILEMENGKVSDSMKSYILPENLLDQIKFVKEGRFVENEGAPALRLIGDAHVLSRNSQFAGSPIPKAIRMQDIIDCFLENKKVSQPLEYIIQACHEQTPYLPMSFFADQCLESIEKIIEEINSEDDASKSQKIGIIDRVLKKPIPPVGSISSATSASIDRKKFYDRLVSGQNITITKTNYLRVCEAITHINRTQANSHAESIRKTLIQLWKFRPNIASNDMTILRKATACFDIHVSKITPAIGKTRLT